MYFHGSIAHFILVLSNIPAPWRRAWQPTPVCLPGESPWTEEPGGLKSMWLQGVGHDRVTKHRTLHPIFQQRCTTGYFSVHLQKNRWSKIGGWHFGGFQVLTIVSKAAVNICVQVFVCVCVCAHACKFLCGHKFQLYWVRSKSSDCWIVSEEYV